MKILVIGGSNFIGWKLVNQLAQQEYEITVINRGNHKRKYPNNVKHVIADRSNIEVMHDFVGNTFFDIVYDMCAFQPQQAKDMISVFMDHVGRYVFISSAAAYLDNQILPLTEDAHCGFHPQWGAYGKAKYDCEKVFVEAFRAYGFPITIIRPSYVYGEGNTIDRETLLFDRISKNMPVFIPNSGYGVIQLGYVDDLCDALELLINSKNGLGEAYNVSGEEYITLNGLVNLISHIIGVKASVIPLQPESFGLAQRQVFPFENNTYFTSITKFKEEFNWSPKVSLIDGLTKAYELWKNNLSPVKTSYKNEEMLIGLLKDGAIK